MDFNWDPELIALRAEVEEFARDAAAGSDVREDSWAVGYSREVSEELGRRGWLGMTWPVEVGGGGRPPLHRFVVAEALISNGAPIAASWFADRQIGPVLLAFGDDDQRRAFLPDMLAGRSSWCVGMSEPDAGSDLAAVRTRAVRDGDTFVVDGRKIWTSFAATADWCYLICRTDPDAPAHRGMSELIVDMRSPGIDVRPIRDMTGTSHFCEVTFDAVRVPASRLVGALNGSFRQVMRQLEHERGGIDRLASNVALLRDSVLDADTADPIVRQEIASLESSYRVGRLLVLREVLGQTPASFSAATKTFCTELEQRVARFAASVAGAEATLWNRIARGVCYSPAYTIMGGTTQVLRNIIGERVLGLPR
ncbi:MAG: acyl-CoA dehydrogenase family protein [Acidimicrobiia bacterium]|nr:acyl-CoA dehydrogenase family protein [Acidimicrobiia bacterium]